MPRCPRRWRSLLLSALLLGGVARPYEARAQAALAAPSAPEAPDATLPPSGSVDPASGALLPADPRAPQDGMETLDPAAPQLTPQSGPPALGDPPQQVGRVVALRGEVSIASEAEPDVYRPAARNRPVVAQDELRCGGDGLLELSLPGGRVFLGPQTRLYVLRADQGGSLLRLHGGQLWVAVPAGGGAPLQVELVADASVQAKAGQLRIDAPAEALAQVVVLQGGQAGVRLGQRSVIVAGNQRLRVQSGAKPVSAGPASTDALAAFVDERQRALAVDAQSNAETLRHVSPQMIGYEDLGANGQWASTPEYGPLWTPSAVPATWVPYRFGHWVYVLPWGWTWVDDMPWGFAPFHYGRWVYWQSRWSWAPGPFWARPVYAPHLVGFGGGLGVGLGGTVSWYPLGFGQAFYPPYACSWAYAQRVNTPYATLGGGVGFHLGPATHVQVGGITSVGSNVFYAGMGIGPHVVPFAPGSGGWTHRAPGPPRGAGPANGRPMAISGPQGAPLGQSPGAPRMPLGQMGGYPAGYVGTGVSPYGFSHGGYNLGHRWPGVPGYGYNYGYYGYGGYGYGGYGRPWGMPAYHYEPHFAPGPMPARPMAPGNHFYPHTMPFGGGFSGGHFGGGFHGGHR